MRYDMSLPWWAWALMGAGLIAFIAMIAASIRRNNGVKRSLFAAPYSLWMILFTVVPVILIAYYAFTDASGAFTLDNFRHFWDSNYIHPDLHRLQRNWHRIPHRQVSYPRHSLPWQSDYIPPNHQTPTPEYAAHPLFSEQPAHIL